MHYTTAMVQLPLVRETGRLAVKTPEQAWEICRDIENLAQEAFHVLILNSKNMLIERCMVTLGLADASLVHPREVFRTAIQKSATAIIAVHNHPSGDPTPSAEDVRITKQLIEAGRIIDIKLLDHIIVGRKTNTTQAFLSMREQRIVGF